MDTRFLCGGMKMFQNCDDGCTTLNTLKPIELYTLNHWIVMICELYLNTAVIKRKQRRSVAA